MGNTTVRAITVCGAAAMASAAATAASCTMVAPVVAVLARHVSVRVVIVAGILVRVVRAHVSPTLGGWWPAADGDCEWAKARNLTRPCYHGGDGWRQRPHPACTKGSNPCLAHQGHLGLGCCLLISPSTSLVLASLSSRPSRGAAFEV